MGPARVGAVQRTPAARRRRPARPPARRPAGAGRRPAGSAAIPTGGGRYWKTPGQAPPGARLRRLVDQGHDRGQGDQDQQQPAVADPGRPGQPGPRPAPPRGVAAAPAPEPVADAHRWRVDRFAGFLDAASCPIAGSCRHRRKGPDPGDDGPAPARACRRCHRGPARGPRDDRAGGRRDGPAVPHHPQPVPGQGRARQGVQQLDPGPGRGRRQARRLPGQRRPGRLDRPGRPRPARPGPVRARPDRATWRRRP